MNEHYIHNNIRSFFGTQNFAVSATNIPGITVFRNQVEGQSIFCVLSDSTGAHRLSASLINLIRAQLEKLTGKASDEGSYISGKANPNILFIIVTSDINRDKGLTFADANIWFADTQAEDLIIYEDQPGDFWGLKAGIESAVKGAFTDGMFTGAEKAGFFGKRAASSNNAAGASSAKNSGQAVRSIPFVTIALIVINVVYYLFTAAQGNPASSSYMLTRGANFAPYVFDGLQLWRLVTAMFVHFSLTHLAGNMIYLGIAGINLERSMGHFRFFLLYFLSGIGGNLVSAAWYQIRGSYVVSGGASSAIYGLIGAISLLTFLSYRNLRPAYIIYRVAILLIFVFYSSFVSTGIDGAAHIGGFFFGILLTFLFIKGKKHEKR